MNSKTVQVPPLPVQRLKGALQKVGNLSRELTNTQKNLAPTSAIKNTLPI
jgi:hypothetical protein